MNEPEDIQRYEQLLSDWKPSPAQKKPEAKEQSHPGAEAFRKAQEAQQRPAAQQTGGEYASGTILRLHEGTIAIYLRNVPEKEYHLVLVLTPNGSVKTQGVALEAYQADALGALPSQYVDEMQKTLRWQRDLIVFHCYSYEETRKLPAPGGAGQPQPAPNGGGTVQTSPQPGAEHKQASANGSEYQRGQRLNIRFGNNAWEAYYWGKDSQGTVVAHCTNNEWALMHLDLDRFGADAEAGEVLPAERIQEIEQSLMQR